MGFSDGEQLTTDSARIFGHSPDWTCFHKEKVWNSSQRTSSIYIHDCVRSPIGDSQSPLFGKFSICNSARSSISSKWIPITQHPPLIYIVQIAAIPFTKEKLMNSRKLILCDWDHVFWYLWYVNEMMIFSPTGERDIDWYPGFSRQQSGYRQWQFPILEHVSYSHQQLWLHFRVISATFPIASISEPYRRVLNSVHRGVVIISRERTVIKIFALECCCLIEFSGIEICQNIVPESIINQDIDPITSHVFLESFPQ
jgi:hypothetical protein